jgi:hypothetical protein
VPAEDDVAHRNLRLAWLVFGLSLAGCGASTPTPESPENPDGTPAASASAEAPVKWSNKVSNKERDDSLTSDQKAQMEIALRRGGEKAAQCITVASDAKPGEGEVKVTFDGKIGKATDAVVGPPWAGLPIVESCIKRAFIGEYIVPFDGQLEVPYPIKLVAKEPPADAKDAKKGHKK